MAKRLWTNFLLESVPASAIMLAGLWLGVDRTGFWSVMGWIIAIAFSMYATLQAAILLSGLARIHRRGHPVQLRF